MKGNPLYEERFLSVVTAATAAATAATSGKAGFPWLSLIDLYTASTDFLTVKSLDGRIGICVIHLYESEAA